jgi:hypothetical protein
MLPTPYPHTGVVRRGDRVAGITALVIAAMLSAGCAELRPIAESERAANVGKPMTWVDANGKRDEGRLRADQDACDAQMKQYSDDAKYGDKAYEFRRCMRLRGWQQIPVSPGK